MTTFSEIVKEIAHEDSDNVSEIVADRIAKDKTFQELVSSLYLQIIMEDKDGEISKARERDVEHEKYLGELLLIAIKNHIQEDVDHFVEEEIAKLEQ